MKFLDHRQKRTGWLLIAIAGGYLVWFLKTRLLTAGMPIDKKEWLYLGGMIICLMLGTANVRLAMRRDQQKADAAKTISTSSRSA